MLDRIGWWCCIAGAVLGVISLVKPDLHVGGLAIIFFILGLVLQWIARRIAASDIGEGAGEIVGEIFDAVDLD